MKFETIGFENVFQIYCLQTLLTVTARHFLTTVLCFNAVLFKYKMQRYFETAMTKSARASCNFQSKAAMDVR